MWGHEELPVSFLIDSGADNSFIDERLVRQLGLPLGTLPEAKTVLDLDRRVIARVTHRTVPIDLLVSGNHRDRIQLFVIPSSSAPAVLLGSPFIIEWATGSLTGWSPFLASPPPARLCYQPSSRRSLSRVARNLPHEWSRLCLDNDLLYRRMNDRKQLVLPAKYNTLAH